MSVPRKLTAAVGGSRSSARAILSGLDRQRPDEARAIVRHGDPTASSPPTPPDVILLILRGLAA